MQKNWYLVNMADTFFPNRPHLKGTVPLLIVKLHSTDCESIFISYMLSHYFVFSAGDWSSWSRIDPSGDQICPRTNVSMTNDVSEDIMTQCGKAKEKLVGLENDKDWEIAIWILAITRKYRLRRYILGVLMHTTAWNWHWGGDETLKLVLVYKA